MDKYPLHRTGATGYNGTGKGTRYERSTVFSLPRSKGKEGEGEMMELLKQPFELFVKNRWLKTIDKECGKYNKTKSKLYRQQYVVNSLM